MLIQVPAATKIIGLILCGVLTLGNAAGNVVSVFTDNNEVIIEQQRNSYVNGHYGDYKFSGKVFDNPSDMGIDDGRISKLTITKDGVEEINYDRGWDMKPDSENGSAYNEIKEKLEHLK